MQKHFYICAALLAAMLSMKTATAHAQSPIVIRFSHVVAADTPKGSAAEFFKRQAEELTRGRVRVEIYANSSLYKDKEEFEALQVGAVQMLAPSLAKFGSLGIREFEVFDLPFLFDGYDSLHRVTDGKVGQKLLSKLESKGIKGLAYWDNGFKSFSANRPIKAPKDFKDLKIRIQPSKVIEAQMRSVGSVPQPLAFSDAYRALKISAFDGTENPMSNFYTQKMHEVQKHVLLTEHGYLGYAVIVNKKFWDGLPADIRGQLERAMTLSTRFANLIAKRENDEALQKVIKSGVTDVHIPTTSERLEFKRVMLSVHKQMESYIGKDVIQDVYAEAGFKPQ